ncbi:MAG: molybdopterin-guanine dinucleotide biosynthesis protein B [Oscillospiraceae bacterium]
MRIFTVRGITKSGKTTTIEKVISELKKRGYSVGSVKEIHYKQFKIDPEGTNTDRHKKAGSELVTARGDFETDVLFQEKLPIQKIIELYEDKYDFLVLEGVADANVPAIVTGHEAADADTKWSDWVFAVSGILSTKVEEYRGVPAIDATKEVERLVDLIEEKTYSRLPDFPCDCCTACGSTCQTLGIEIMNGRKSREDCILQNAKVHIKIGGKEVQMVPFVRQIVKNTVLSVISELDGYSKDKSIEVTIDGE